MKRFPVLLLLILGAVRFATAQSCPQSISVASRLKQDIPGWGVSGAEGTHELQGVSIIEGPQKSGSDDVNDLEAILAPVEINKILTWPFRKLRESDEIWMRCWYSGTSVEISTRVRPGVVECFRKEVPSTNQPGKMKVVVMCVDDTKKKYSALP